MIPRSVHRALILLFGLLPIPFVSAATPADANRVVVLGGSITEIIYALHREERIAAVDTTSLFPPSALKDKPNVGYVRSLSAEGVLSLRPDLILSIDGAGPPDALTLIRQTGVAFVTIPDDPTPDGIHRKIDAIGKVLGDESGAAALDRDVTAGFASLAVLRTRIVKPRRVLFVLSLQNGRSMVGGRHTSADGMIRLAGSVNAADDIDGYKPITDEAIVAAAPDVILTMQNDRHALSADTVFAMPAYAATPAAKTRSLVSLDGLLLLGFGPRTPAAATTLIRALYPDLAPAP
ncbi:heme/hemin ABC transporter substrate-binding protein [Lichenihabitans psoromatis]|uniref:heme/hemin ABC transporter substrate-binding protein n=1 Tax=Lichenihabitans psoromatis TaxID=2528642 RepID=UPI0010384029|nr:ABC transporter substrate-binding protein [Lichenihabitans psoromatis]